MSETFDRSQLDGKDRDQLSEIASALGVKSVSRMRKADLVEAIVTAATGSNGAARPSPRKIRSTQASGGDDLATIAEEENALAGAQDSGDEMALIRPRRRATIGDPGSGNGREPDSSSNGSAAVASERDASPTATKTEPESLTRTDTSEHDLNDTDTGSVDRSQPGQQQWRDDDGSANKRRRRRRGRDRERGPADGRPGEGRPERAERVDRGEDYGGELIDIEGLLDLRDEGYGFLRASGYLAGRNDAYVSASQVRRFGLRKGDHVKGATRPPASSEKYPALVRVDLINEISIEAARHRVRFEDLTPLFPDSRLRLELDDRPGEITGRIIDLIAPIGKGQRGMIVTPPKAGKTTIIKQIIYSIERNDAECHVIVLH